MESAQLIPEGSLDRFKKQSRRAHAEPLKLLHGLANALRAGAGLNLDDFRSCPQPASAAKSTFSDRKTLVVTCDEDPKQRGAQYLCCCVSRVRLQAPPIMRMRGFNLMLYNLKLRMMVRREEHHRLVNDADHATKHESLWGPLAS